MKLHYTKYQENYKNYILACLDNEDELIGKNLPRKEKIKYLPTIVLYNDGEEILKLESDISLKLKPENWRDILLEHIEILLSQRF